MTGSPAPEAREAAGGIAGEGGLEQRDRSSENNVRRGGGLTVQGRVQPPGRGSLENCSGRGAAWHGPSRNEHRPRLEGQSGQSRS